ncbi:hypothetical protein B0H67DRAFT_377383 [Lasiosphaeris hirsuta]|uniref:Uncharacterized protein n=1 Tax=Lasiosphaeris hirsuta TaxID=260670 RepID=A0AA39ZX43_9PEZI|nr:hypothetical protein B0H67DRAFT_377383 [Lasiosphaeris hirsuta]
MSLFILSHLSILGYLSPALFHPLSDSALACLPTIDFPLPARHPRPRPRPGPHQGCIVPNAESYSGEKLICSARLKYTVDRIRREAWFRGFEVESVPRSRSAMTGLFICLFYRFGVYFVVERLCVAPVCLHGLGGTTTGAAIFIEVREPKHDSPTTTTTTDGLVLAGSNYTWVSLPPSPPPTHW